MHAPHAIETERLGRRYGDVRFEPALPEASPR